MKINETTFLVGVSVVYDVLSKMPLEYAIATVCTTLDYIFTDRGMTKEEALEMYKWIYEAAKECYEILGMAK